MITIIYTGTSIRHRLLPMTEELQAEILQSLDAAYEQCALRFGDAQYTESEHLNDDIVLFSVSIDLLPRIANIESEPEQA